MRISDWSSDVCSSDLRLRRRVSAVQFVELPLAGLQVEMSDGIEAHRLRAARIGRVPAVAMAAGLHPRIDPREFAVDVIQPILLDRVGRAVQVEGPAHQPGRGLVRSEEHTSELQSLMRISYAVFCLTKKKNQ